MAESVTAMLDRLQQMYKDKLLAKDLEINQLQHELENAKSIAQNAQKTETKLNETIIKLEQENKQVLHEHTSHIITAQQQSHRQHQIITNLRSELKKKQNTLDNVLDEIQQLKDLLNDKEEELISVTTELNTLKESK